MSDWLLFWGLVALLAVVIPGWLLIHEMRRQERPSATLIIAAAAIAFLIVLLVHDLRVLILGPDYSQSLYVTVWVVFSLMSINAIFALVRKMWFAAAASVLIALAWYYLGVVNSAI